MKASSVVVITLAALTSTNVQASAVGGPVSKVFEMLGDLQGKIIKQGEDAQKTFDQFSEWCEDRSKNTGFEIKTGKSEEADLLAAIEKNTAKISASGTKIEELAGSIAGDDADLKAATKIRTSEKADFGAEEAESRDVISTLERAIAVLKRGGAAMLQTKGTQNMAQALASMVQASVLSSADATRLTALVQDGQSQGDEALGAPAAAVYENKGGGIVGVLEDLLDKATEQLEAARKTESTNAHNYEMLKQSLEDEIAAADKDMAEEKASLAASQESKATAEGDLSVTVADLKEDQATLGTLHQDCRTGSEDFEAETKSRADELNALAQAKKVLTEALPAAAQTYGAALDQAATFLQVSTSKLASGADLAKFEAVRFIRDLARKENSVALAQLASKMSSVIRFGASAGSDPFTKVKALISDMIAKLESDAKSEASQKAFCDKETSETITKKGEKKYEISKLGTKIESMMAASAKLKEESATLQQELAELASSQNEANKIRAEEKALFGKNKAELEAGISGVQQALSVLRDYYAKDDKSHAAAGGVGAGIVSMLEVVESDFTKSLAEMNGSESSAALEYEATTQMGKVTTASKDKDVEYKKKEAASLDKSVAEATSDKDGVQAELDALLEYLAKLGKMCIAKAEPFAERVARRTAEVAGLKEALSILEGGAALLQQSSKRVFLHGRK